MELFLGQAFPAVPFLACSLSPAFCGRFEVFSQCWQMDAERRLLEFDRFETRGAGGARFRGSAATEPSADEIAAADALLTELNGNEEDNFGI